METSTTVLTLRLDNASFAHFNALRQEWYPPALNRIPAHLSLFHVLPADYESRAKLTTVASSTQRFTAQVSELRSLGRGVAFVIASDTLQALHRQLANAFADVLVPQDRQGFRPHIVVQNKVTPEEARKTLERLRSDFVPREIECLGLDWWDYLGGPWKLRETFPFAV